MTTYISFPHIETVHGSFRLEVVSEFDGLAAPAIQTVLSPGKISKNAFVTLNEQEIGQLQLLLREDYSDPAVPEGFWFKIFSGYHEVRLFLVETDDTYLHWFTGIIDQPTSDWDTWSLIDGKRIRTPNVTLLSTLSKIFDPTIITVASYVAEVIANSISVIPEAGVEKFNYVISVRGLFACLLSASGLNSSYSRDDASFLFGVDYDLFYMSQMSPPDESHSHHLGHLYVPIKIDDGGTTFLLDYWDQYDESYLNLKYNSIQDMISAFIQNWGIRLSIYFDYDAGRYRIQLRQNWRTFSGTQAFATEALSEKQTNATDVLVGDWAKASQLTTPDNMVFSKDGTVIVAYTDSTAGLSYAAQHIYRSSGNFATDGWTVRAKGKIVGTSGNNGIAFTVQAVGPADMTVTSQNGLASGSGAADVLLQTDPDGVSFDMEVVLPFNIPYAPVNYEHANCMLGSNTEIESGDACPPVIVDLAWWNYAATSRPGTATRTGYPLKMEEAIAGYNCARFSYKYWRKFIHTYGHITANDGGGLTFADVDMQKRRTIDDNQVTKNYFANKVDIDPDTSELTIEWVQEST
jgi:hypothetical protein